MKRFMTIKLGIISINLFTLPAFIFAVIFDYAGLFFISFLSVLIHELSHILCAKAVKVKISHIEIHPFGVCAVLKNGYINDSEKEFLIAFAGPFTSLFIAMLTAIIKPSGWEYIFDINICICAINLLPALPLDGGRMIKSMLTYKMGILRAYNISQKFGKLLIFILLPLSVLVLIKTKFNFSYVLITAFLAGNIYDEQKNITLITLKEILENPNKTTHLKRTKIYSASMNESARKILKLISYDYFLILNITEDGKIIATLTEEQILSGILGKGITATFRDLIS